MSAQTETETLQRLYELAKAEGGSLVVYAGGDAPEQTAMYTAGFTEAFPEIDIDVTVDLSKYQQWPAREDLTVADWKAISEYPNTDPRGLVEFMADRARVERLRGIMEDLIGPVEGDNPTGVDRYWR